MKRRAFVASISAALSAPGFLRAEEAPKRLVVGTDTSNKPFVFVRDGGFAGFSYDLWDQIAKEIKASYSMRSMDFSALIPALQTKNIDVAFSSIFITPARKEVVDFSDPYYFEGIGVLVRPDSAIKGAKDLEGKNLASVTGSAQVGWIKEHVPSATQTQFPGVTDAFFAIRAGRADAVLYDYSTLAYYAATDGKGNVRLLEQRVGDNIPVGFAFPKGSALVAKTNEALKKLRADGRYDVLVRKWFGKSAS
jgi:glutamine transport system substrate-binding protein